MIMPILDVEIVQRDEAPLDAQWAARIADAAGDILASQPMRTWVRLRSLPLSQYAENGGGPPKDVLPVFITILIAILPPLDQRQSQLQQLTERIAEICQRPVPNVHAMYLPEGTGRVAFGGKLI